MADYLDGLRAVDLTIMVEATLGDYQGDIVALVKNDSWSADERKFGFIVIGYGSCSGCDAWQAADTPEEKWELVKELLASIKWYTELDEAKAYIADGGGRDLEWFAHEKDWPAFVAAVQAADEYTEKVMVD